MDSPGLQVLSRSRTLSHEADDGLRTRDLRLGKPRRAKRRWTTIGDNRLQTTTFGQVRPAGFAL